MTLMKEIAGYPRKAGSFEIEQYLFSEGLRPGCWINGETTVADISWAGQNWLTYSCPVFAYLQHVATIRSNVQTEHEREITVSEGFSKSFTESTQATAGFSMNFGPVNVGSELTAMCSVTETISSTHTVKRSLKVKGQGTIMVYQVHLVYAHHVTGAGRLYDALRYAKLFQLVDLDDIMVRDDLVLLSSVVCDQLIPVQLEASIKPLTWREVNQAVLFDQYEREPGSRRWNFNFAVR